MSNQPGIFANAVNLNVGGAAQASAASEDARTTSGDDAVHDVVIVGSGPAGYTAAIYTARANLKPVVLAGSVTAGGELMNTTDVENYPGFIDGIMGPDLMNNMQQQAERFGADIRYEDVVSVELDGEIKTVTVEDGTVLRARAVIISTGSEYRKLGLEDEERLSGHGVSWCATCDGFFFKKQNIAVVGGGDSAIEEATFLTKFADKVTLIHRRDRFRASEIMQQRAFDDPKIEILWNTKVTGIQGADKVESLALEDTVTGETSELAVTGVFVAIGSDPRVGLVKDQLELTVDNTIAVDGRSSTTSLPGVFAAGDVVDATYRQAITAAGSGCVAAVDVEHYLAALDS
ncbi:thioredoxin-disulfide reductase [Kocuria marina]|uniref:thioredoxin-disulfide reductase n=1 Tax=Kocuria marina TaxID=223184 RepID=UPI0022E047E1|nr:thioredoxin-disulfide reductase [Kocuria marina]